MRRLLPLVLVVLISGGCSLRRAGPPPSPHCRSGSPLVGVYHPQRLKVKSRCRVAVGTVEKVKPELYDGDVHIELRLDRGQEGLLSSGNARVGGTRSAGTTPWHGPQDLAPLKARPCRLAGPGAA